MVCNAVKLGKAWRANIFTCLLSGTRFYRVMLTLWNETLVAKAADGVVWAYRFTIDTTPKQLKWHLEFEVACAHSREDEQCPREDDNGELLECSGGWKTEQNIVLKFPWWRWCK